MMGGLESLGLVLRSRDNGEVQLGGETGGLEAPLDLGVMLLKADGPLELGECIDEASEVLRDDESEEGETRE